MRKVEAYTVANGNDVPTPTSGAYVIDYERPNLDATQSSSDGRFIISTTGATEGAGTVPGVVFGLMVPEAIQGQSRQVLVYDPATYSRTLYNSLLQSMGHQTACVGQIERPHVLAFLVCARIGQQILDQASHPAGAVDRVSHELPAIVVQLVVVTLCNQIAVTPDHAQRFLQLL